MHSATPLGNTYLALNSELGTVLNVLGTKSLVDKLHLMSQVQPHCLSLYIKFYWNPATPINFCTVYGGFHMTVPD